MWSRVKTPPPAKVHKGNISAVSIILAPIIFPMVRDISFFLIAFKAVTSSGNEVPIATNVTAITF